MPKYELANKNSKSGNFFVDTRCIGCSTCKNIAHDIFEVKENLSYVKKQPTSQIELENSILALLSCPVSSIGMKENKDSIKEISKKLPLEIVDNIYFCSNNSKKSYGAFSYFIKREKGNILIDSPNFDKQLVKNIEELGGIKYIYLTHKDDVADYKMFKEYFNAKVIFHKDDFNINIIKADITLTTDNDYILDDEIKIILQRGHTKGHTVLLYKNKYLFSGDNLAYNLDGKYLYAFKNFCWYDWNIQLNSLKKLLNYDFSHVFAGHGGSYYGSITESKKLLKKYLIRENAI